MAFWDGVVFLELRRHRITSVRVFV